MANEWMLFGIGNEYFSVQTIQAYCRSKNNEIFV